MWSEALHVFWNFFKIFYFVGIGVGVMRAMLPPENSSNSAPPRGS